MYLIIRIGILSVLVLFFKPAFAQGDADNPKSMELGLHIAGDETLFYGAYGKYNIPLSQTQHYPFIAFSLTTYGDLKGESEAAAYLKNDVDMRIIPAIHPAYSFNFKRLQLNVEVPVGASVAITKGTLVNERAGFKRDYANTEMFWHYGLAFSPKYRLNKGNQLGLFGFLPLVPDKARSGYIIGIGWTKAFAKQY